MSCEGNDRVATPPKLYFTLKTESDFNNKPHDWSSDEIQSQLPTDILLITANDHESNACYSYMKRVQRGYCEKLRRCVDFGQFGDEDYQNVRVALMKCELGSNEGLLAVKDAAKILNPKAVLFVGICASMKPTKVKLGDVVISAKLGTYDRNVRPDGTVEYRGAKVSQTMARLILSAADGWKPPLKDPSSLKIKVHRDAVMLSGPELVDNRERQQDLVDYCRDALGLEMESAGIYAAANDLKMEWAVIKGVSRFAGSEDMTEHWQPFASKMAASVVYNMFKYPVVLQDWPRNKEMQDAKASREDRMPGGRHRHKSRTQDSKDKGKKRRSSEETSYSLGSCSSCDSGAPRSPTDDIDVKGMLTSREDRMPGGRHRHKSQTQDSKDKGKKRRASEETSYSLGSCSSCDSGAPRSPTGDIDVKGMLNQLTENGLDQIPDADCSHICNDEGEYDANVFLALELEDLKIAIRWTKSVPGFAELIWDDKVCLIRASWMDIILLRLSYRSLDYPKGTTVFGRSLIMKHSEVTKMGWWQDMINYHDEFTDKLRILHLDKNEFACLCALVLLTSDCPEVVNKAKVKVIQSQISSVLQECVRSQYRDQPNRLAEVLQCIPTLKTYSAKAIENYTAFERSGKMDMPQLVRELLFNY